MDVYSEECEIKIEKEDVKTEDGIIIECGDFAGAKNESEGPLECCCGITTMKTENIEANEFDHARVKKEIDSAIEYDDLNRFKRENDIKFEYDYLTKVTAENDLATSDDCGEINRVMAENDGTGECDLTRKKTTHHSSIEFRDPNTKLAGANVPKVTEDYSGGNVVETEIRDIKIEDDTITDARVKAKNEVVDVHDMWAEKKRLHEEEELSTLLGDSPDEPKKFGLLLFGVISPDAQTPPIHRANHDRANSVEKPFACDSCDYRCSKAKYLKRHLKTHSGEKPFACGSCDYRCSRAENLRRHLRTHTGEKPFACDSCDYMCSRAEHLKRHLRTHTGEKPFACDSCDYRCSRAYDLNRHSGTHSEKEPLACDSCDYRCSTVGDFIRHMRTHSGGKSFACDSCDNRCSTAGDEETYEDPLRRKTVCM